jgi:flagellar basal body-associated protein FliL
MNKKGSLVVLMSVLIVLVLLVITGLIVYYVTSSSGDLGISDTTIASDIKGGSGTVIEDPNSDLDAAGIEEQFDESSQQNTANEDNLDLNEEKNSRQGHILLEKLKVDSVFII